jgi:hypothetical protein
VGARTGSQITERDRELLGLLAEHRVMVVPQVAVGLGVADGTAAARLRHLHELRLIGYEAIFREQPAAAWIARRGLDAIGSRLPPPSIDLKGYPGTTLASAGCGSPRSAGPSAQFPRLSQSVRCGRTTCARTEPRSRSASPSAGSTATAE